MPQYINTIVNSTAFNSWNSWNSFESITVKFVDGPEKNNIFKFCYNGTDLPSTIKYKGSSYKILTKYHNKEDQVVPAKLLEEYTIATGIAGRITVPYTNELSFTYDSIIRN